MHEERLIELLNAEIDGELDAAGQAELDALLEASPDAQAARAAYRGMAGLLDDLPDLDPPAEFAASVLDKVRPAADPAPAVIPMRARRAPWLGYGLAAAAGLLVGAVALQLTLHAPEEPDWLDLTGAMVSEGRIDGPELDGFTVDTNDVDARVSLNRAGDGYVVRAMTQSEQALALSIDLSGSGLEFGGLTQPDDDNADIEIQGSRLTMTTRGTGEFAIFLRAGNGAGIAGPLEVDLSSSGRSVHRQSLRVRRESTNFFRNRPYFG